MVERPENEDTNGNNDKSKTTEKNQEKKDITVKDEPKVENKEMEQEKKPGLFARLKNKFLKKKNPDENK